MKLDFFFLDENLRLLRIIPYCLGCNISSTQYLETDSADKSVESLWTLKLQQTNLAEISCQKSVSKSYYNRH